MRPKGEDEQGQMRISGGGRIAHIKRFVVTTAIILVILWGTTYLALRTEQGHRFAEQRLSNRLGLPVAVETVRLGFPLALIYRGIQSSAVDNGAALRIKILKAGIGYRHWIRLTVGAPELTLVWEDDAGWRPAPFAKLGDLPGATPAAVAEVARRLPAGWRVEVHDGAVRWNTANETFAAVSGLRFTARRAAVPGHRMRYFQLAFHDALLAGGEQVPTTRMEWLSSSALPYISLNYPDAAPLSWFAGDDTDVGAPDADSEEAP